ncbi:hypothetical protein ACFQHO_04750 [Actinomadura yumaensis]|uniref:hypothetical protein n=1 Tax=Actinomadura yumaensis TaxID=111807 RepID=UPI0036163E61
MLVPDRAELGRWLLDAKPLLRQGLAWYLPTYTCRGRWYDHRLATELDYLVKDRRVIDLTGADPLKLELMRNVLTVEVPHVAGTDLNTFAKIVTGEFDAFRDFREYLREELLELHLAADAVDSARQIELVATRIRRQVGEWTARMKDARRGRAWGLPGPGWVPRRRRCHWCLGPICQCCWQGWVSPRRSWFRNARAATDETPQGRRLVPGVVLSASNSHSLRASDREGDRRLDSGHSPFPVHPPGSAEDGSRLVHTTSYSIEHSWSTPTPPLGGCSLFPALSQASDRE